MKPSLTEVTEYFKNAKEVKCDLQCYKGETFLLDGEITFEPSNNSYYSDTTRINSDVCLYCGETNQYAEIISYKVEETLTIKKSTLLQLAGNNSFSESIIKKEFPQLFDCELEVGKWYKSKLMKDFLFLPLEKTENGYEGCKINDGIFSENYEVFYNLDKLYLATEQEVFEALKNEAIKRGYKEGVKYINATNKLHTTTFKSFKFLAFYSDKNLLTDGCGGSIFSKGQWATIVEQPKELTISEIEKILGYKILIKE